MLDKGKTSGSFSELFTKKFHRYRVEQGIYDEQKDFHSLRHDFNVKLREKRVSGAARKRLMGHFIPDVTDGIYDVHGEAMQERLEFVNLIDYGVGVTWIAGIAVISVRPSETCQKAA